MLIPSTPIRATLAADRAQCQLCLMLTPWRYNLAGVTIVACRPDHAEKALRESGAKTAVNPYGLPNDCRGPTRTQDPASAPVEELARQSCK